MTHHSLTPTSPRVLVAVASAQGATRDIATAIAAALREAGLDADARDVSRVPSLDGYGAVVLGSAIHTHNWLPEAVVFADRHATALRERPTWLFSSGMLVLDTGAAWPEPYPEGIDGIVAATGARQHRIFLGRRNLPRPHALWRLLGKGIMWYAIKRGLAPKGSRLTGGDHRDWPAIRAWATEIATALRPAAPARAA